MVWGQKSEVKVSVGWAPFGGSEEGSSPLLPAPTSLMSLGPGRTPPVPTSVPVTAASSWKTLAIVPPVHLSLVKTLFPKHLPSEVGVYV
jgi:hypothetical protein